MAIVRARRGWVDVAVFGAVVVLASGLLLSLCSSPGARGERTAKRTMAVACAPDNGGLTLPPGFCATVFADEVGHARHPVVASSGVDAPQGGEGGTGIARVALYAEVSDRSVVARSLPGYGAYIASKAGVEGLVRVLANELRGHAITVNAVAPGPVATELFLKGKTEAQTEQFAKLAPLERLGRPEDIAEVISFLAGPDGGWVNAQVLRANGGFA